MKLRLSYMKICNKQQLYLMYTVPDTTVTLIMSLKYLCLM